MLFIRCRASFCILLKVLFFLFVCSVMWCFALSLSLSFHCIACMNSRQHLVYRLFSGHHKSTSVLHCLTTILISDAKVLLFSPLVFHVFYSTITTHSQRSTGLLPRVRKLLQDKADLAAGVHTKQLHWHHHRPSRKKHPAHLAILSCRSSVFQMRVFTPF